MDVGDPIFDARSRIRLRDFVVGSLLRISPTVRIYISVKVIMTQFESMLLKTETISTKFIFFLEFELILVKHKSLIFFNNFKQNNEILAPNGTKCKKIVHR